MPIKQAVGAVTGVWVLLATVPAMAHHAFSAEFDAKQPVTLRGTIVKVEWINPHSWFHVDVKEPNGKDRKSTRLNSSHIQKSRMPSSA